MAIAVLSGCATQQLDVARPLSHALVSPEQTALGRAFGGPIARHDGRSGFLVLDDGPRAFAARATLADSAQRTLDLQYFIVEDNRSSQELLGRLIVAAQRGVRVRILLDDLHEANRAYALRARRGNPNIEARLFNPFKSVSTAGLVRATEFASDSDRLNRRMHNKLWLADNVAGVFGGRNLGDNYFEADPDVSFSDLDMLAVGPVVRELSAAFDRYWNGPSAVPVAAFFKPDELLPAAPPRDGAVEPDDRADVPDELSEQTVADLKMQMLAGSIPLTWAEATVVVDDPEKSVQEASHSSGRSPHMREVLRMTQSELLVISPYFVPSSEGRRLLGETGRRGVRVAVLTNSLASTDVTAAQAGYARYRADLLREGVELYELRPQVLNPSSHRGHRWRRAATARLHAKMVVVDREKVFLGSMNMDPRSRIHNTEGWVSIRSREIAAELVDIFREATRPDHAYTVELANNGSADDALVWTAEEGGESVRYDSDPDVGLWRRFLQSLLGLLIPEHML